ncbi:rhomboid family intramembrane serine protease [Chitinophaga agrisoli]|uniref:Rhomboid family intramembrane serine protease n=1 Tax=Chitinophaga agrisoli TaxID=2607653 RepID=A0A5B2W0D2_9BACT|nr:rhomboid family intramembrane serine protease [Chitinophaga agrisoli]KAA2245121.1 rhomboid family intramembrane serine protease [Chitinophaga agrisoli]
MRTVEKERIPSLTLGEERNIVTQILVVNLTIFILLLFTRVIYNMEGYSTAQFESDVLAWTALPANPARLLTRPWTLITAMFSHVSVWQVFSNMVWLWAFGTLLQNLAGHQRILPLYLYGGFCGAIFYVMGMHAIPAFESMLPTAAMMGASASVMALAIGVTAVAPNYRIFPLLGKGIPLWVITLIFVALHIASHILTPADETQTYIPALVGGGLTGLLYMTQWKKGKDWGAGLNRVAYKATHLFHPAPQDHPEVALIKKRLNLPSSGNSAFRRVGSVPEQRLNEILDKINEQGMDALTPEEQETLLRASKQDIS